MQANNLYAQEAILYPIKYILSVCQFSTLPKVTLGLVLSRVCETSRLCPE